MDLFSRHWAGDSRETWRSVGGASAGILACVLFACLLSRGTNGGDEKGVLNYLSYYDKHGWEALRTQFGTDGFLAHRLFWLGEKFVWSRLLKLLSPVLAHSELATNYALTLDGPLFMVAAFALGVRHLQRRGHAPAIALLAPSALLIASSGIGLFTGGFSECAMCLLVVGIMALLDREQLSAGDLVAFSFCGFLLITAKLYAAPFMLILTLLLRTGARNRLIVTAIFLAAPFAWLVVESAAQVASDRGVINMYIHFADQRSVVLLGANAIAFFLSLSFGILPCFPLLLLVCAIPASARRVLIIKITAILGVAALLLSIKFWAGPGGLGGPRYIVPFLLILAPEIAMGMIELARRRRRILLLVPLLAMFFLPTLEYRNSLIPRYAEPPLPQGSFYSMPNDYIALHPAIFAWRVLAAKKAGVALFRPGYPPALAFPTAGIFPMTGLSRAIYVLDRGASGPPQIQPVYSLLVKYGLNATYLFRAIALVLLACLLAILTLAAVRPEDNPFRP